MGFKAKTMLVEKNIHSLNEVVAKSSTSDEDVHVFSRGSLKGKIWMSDDFNESLEDFKDYMGRCIVWLPI